MKEENFESVVKRVSMVSIVGNLLLSLCKLLAGILSGSGAMISDAIHSSSDVFSTVIVLIGVKVATKESDKEHPYGHERFECVAAILLADVLAVTGVLIAKEAVYDIYRGTCKEIGRGGFLALTAALVSVLTKELMYQYTRKNALRIDSTALLADAWHHRSDALSSVGALVGIGGAMLGYPMLDAAASIVICVFIVKAAYEIFADATGKLVDHSCDVDFEQELHDFALSQEGVLEIDLLQTRIFGNKIYVDMEIGANGNQTLWESHAIAERLHDAVEKRYPKVKHIMVHVNPVEEKTQDKS